MARAPKAKVGHKADDRPGRDLVVAPVGSLAPHLVPPMPLSLPDGAAETWAVVCMSLPELSASDLGDVEICVSALYDYRRYSTLLEQMGYTREVENPETGEVVTMVPDAVLKLDRMRQNAANRYRYHSDQLGLSRMARARLGLIRMTGMALAQAVDQRIG